MNNCTGILKITDKDISQSLLSVVHFVAAVRIILRNWWAAINADFMAGNRSVSRDAYKSTLAKVYKPYRPFQIYVFAQSCKSKNIQLNQTRNPWRIRRIFIAQDIIYWVIHLLDRVYFIFRKDRRVGIASKGIFMMLHEEKSILRAITIIILLTCPTQ